MRANLSTQDSRNRDPHRPPNIVVIIADDMGYSDLGPHTPRLNRMAADGIQLTNFYVTAPMCTPARSALLTGRHQIRTGLIRSLFPDDPRGLSQWEITLPEVLSGQGYATAMIGKWHLGDRQQYLPTRHGFDRFYGVPYSNDMTPFVLMRDETIIEKAVDQTMLTRLFTDEATRFISDSVRSGKPFFLCMAHTLLHTPIYLPDEPADHGELYSAALEELDNSVGAILDHIALIGVDNNTFVVFSSDNGPVVNPSPPPDHAEPWRWVGGSAGTLRGGKHTVWDGGVRVPFVARWPGYIQTNAQSDEPVIITDLYPTLIALAGGVVPSNRPIDGEDISNVLLGTGARPTQDFLFYFYHPNPQPAGYPIAVRSGKWKLYLRNDFSPVELYDLERDPGELRPENSPEIKTALADRAWSFYRSAVADSTSDLARNKPTSASSQRTDEGSTKDKVVDGNTKTCWASEYRDMSSSQACDQWIYVDLGSTETINAVVLRWETAYGKRYEIQISDDAETWRTIFSENEGTGGVDYIDGLLGRGRYVRMLGIEPGTESGYSLSEFAVYGVGASSPANLALNQPVTASSHRGRNYPRNAVAGDTSKRWSSEWSDDQWIYVDLGAVTVIGQVILRWERAYGKKYEIQVSNDATTWTTVYRERGGTGGTDFINGLNARGRYVRMKGIERGTQWGYSLWEFEVCGIDDMSPVNLALNRPVAASSHKKGNHPRNAVAGDTSKRWSSRWSDNQWILVDLESIKAINRVVLRWEAAFGKDYEIQVSNNARNWSTIFHETDGQGGVDDIRGLSASGRYVRMKGNQRGTQWGYSLWEFEVYELGYTPPSNLALYGAVTASSHRSLPHTPDRAVDGSTMTRWSSEWSDDQWIYVDLGSIKAINRVVLRWEAAFGKDYEIQVSNNARNWSTIFHETDGQGGVDDIIGLSVSGRYVRMKGNQRGTQWGYSLWEFEVYGN